MEKLKLLIAEGTEEFRLALADVLRGAFHVRQCADGNEAKAMMRSFKPDVMVLDLMLPGLDGISLLQWALSNDLHPMVLATTCFHNEYVVESMIQMNVGYLMMKPCDLHATVARIGDLSERIRPTVVTLPDRKSYVSNLLLALGIPTKLRGYAYLREAILLMLTDPHQSITKVLYPEVARICRCAPMHVERSIRSAITAAWTNRDDRLWRLYFKPDSSGNIERPSNGAFLTRMVNALQNEFRCEEI